MSEDRQELRSVDEAIRSGGDDTTQPNIGAFFEQAEEYQRDTGFIDHAYKVLNLLGQRHPFAVLRLTELKTWADSGAFQSILDGAYIQRSQETDETTADFQEATETYKGGFDKAKESAWEGINSIRDTLDSLFKRPESKSGNDNSKSNE